MRLFGCRLVRISRCCLCLQSASYVHFPTKILICNYPGRVWYLLFWVFKTAACYMAGCCADCCRFFCIDDIGNWIRMLSNVKHMDCYCDIMHGLLVCYDINGCSIYFFWFWGEPFQAGCVLIVHSKITFSIARNVIMIGLLFSEKLPWWQFLVFYRLECVS